jgi:hypothetical protein
MRTSSRRAYMGLLQASLMQAYSLNALFTQAPTKCFNDDAYSHLSSCQTDNWRPHLSSAFAVLQHELYRLASSLVHLVNQLIQEYLDE